MNPDEPNAFNDKAGMQNMLSLGSASAVSMDMCGGRFSGGG